jgi:hypothetical protein
VHAVAFAASLYLPAGHSTPLLLDEPKPQNEPGLDEHAPEQDAESAEAAPLTKIL